MKIKKYKINIREDIVKNTEVVIETNEDIDNILDVVDKASNRSAEDYIYNLREKGVTVIEVIEGDFEVNEVECDDLFDR